MIIKVCGLTQQENHDTICDLGINMVGINFYEPSSRYIGEKRLSKKRKELRVGVFVKASLEEIQQAQFRYQLDYAQLHGDEDADYCKKIAEHIAIIKVFRIGDDFDWRIIEGFQSPDYFLFDTSTPLFGGSGKKFDWAILEQYTLDIPFLLSGGIGPQDAELIKELHHPQFVGIDINSKFESAPGIKDADQIAQFIYELKLKS